MSAIKNESSALRYMTDNGVAEGDAAQNFLQNKLNKNIQGKYTSEQLDNLAASGGAAVVNASDGAIPAGEYYDSQNPTKNGGDGVAASGGALDYSHMTGDSDTHRNYREGNWGRGELNAEQLAEKFGLDRSQEGTGEGHIWGENPDGSKVYIGKSNMGLASNSELIKAHSAQANPLEGDHSALGEDLSSSGDIKGAILNQWKAGGKKAVVKEEENKPIEHSPEQKQAVERVRAYENDTFSGKTSDDIFGGIKGVAGSQYAFDAQAGSGGINAGVKTDSASDDADKAAASFLQNKKESAKKYIFESSYGQ